MRQKVDWQPVAGFLALVVAVALVVTLIPFRGAVVGVVDADAEARFVELVNRSRAEQGLPALLAVTDLRTAARAHTAVMASTTNLHHNPDLATDVTNWRVLAENVGYGYTVETLHEAFMNSPGHRANILDDEVTEIGVGVEVEGGRIWITKVFRLPRDPSLSVPVASGSTSSSSSSSTSTSSSGGGTPLWGDWDGDGVETPGWFQDGRFELSNRRTGGGTLITLQYGRAGDKPVVGDWDGDGVDSIGVVRGNRFLLRNRYVSGDEALDLEYGRSTDKPVVGDWDGDGIDTIGVVRGNLFILRNEYRRGAEDIVLAYGQDSDVPVTGDWDADGRDTIGVVRGSLWILRNEYRRGAQDIVMSYGEASDHKMSGDYNGDGRDTLGIVRGDLWVLRSEYRSGARDLTFRWR